MTAWYLPDEGSPPRFAWAVSRKVGSAVVRNRLRRRLREIVEQLARDGSVEPGAYLVGVSPAAAERSFRELKENVAATLRAASDAGRPRPDPASPEGPR